MPKMKSHRGAAKRFKVTSSGRVKHRAAFRNHILTKKSTKRLRHLRGMAMLSKADTPAIRTLLLK